MPYLKLIALQLNYQNVLVYSIIWHHFRPTGYMKNLGWTQGATRNSMMHNIHDIHTTYSSSSEISGLPSGSFARHFLAIGRNSFSDGIILMYLDLLSHSDTLM